MIIDDFQHRKQQFGLDLPDTITEMGNSNKKNFPWQ